jgi:hypothetical protein
LTFVSEGAAAGLLETGATSMEWSVYPYYRIFIPINFNSLFGIYQQSIWHPEGAIGRESPSRKASCE